MKKLQLLAVSLACVPLVFAAEEVTTLPTGKDKASYGIGADIGRSFRERGIEVSVEALLQGLKDAYAGRKLLLTDEESAQALEAFQKEFASKRQKQMEERAGKNKAEGEKFLAENGKKEGVKTLPSGLQYKVVKSGEGRKPKGTDVVKTHYRGTFIDGKEFDSSYSRNEPATFQVNGVIAGWTEALQLMSVGSKWQLFIPADLAYGAEGRGPEMPPNSTLLFDVELLSIEEQKEAVQ